MADNYFLDPLMDLIGILKSEKGCPWDKNQTPFSLAKYLVEESHEAYEAIHSGKIESIKDELGDTLFQLCFIVLLYQEQGLFTFEDIVEKSVSKMKFRHPHVFSDEKACCEEEVKKIWENVKQLEKKDKFKSVMDSVPSGLPALMKALEVSEKAVKCGFEWSDLEGVFEKVFEEIEELKETFDKKLDFEDKQMEFGDLLFTLVNSGRFLGIESEAALLKACDKFEKRFRWMEKKVLSEGKEFESIDRIELENFWEISKKIYP
ncbi:MAG: nucleoside triphosphate pyrophosphohydrolase [Desulforegulaceae bacterium]|nr:nucleoside triphosphate pyrophosphohydrolase [Desulforegulaceae bacterium]